MEGQSEGGWGSWGLALVGGGPKYWKTWENNTWKKQNEDEE